MDKELLGEFVMRCFQARTDTHVAHLLTDSYATHKALNKFYDAIIDLADSFAEAAQGRLGMLDYVEVPSCGCYGKPDKIVRDLRDWVEDACGDIEAEDLKNIAAEVVELCNSTLYKLRFLK
jgi:hypothetical protein